MRRLRLMELYIHPLKTLEKFLFDCHILLVRPISWEVVTSLNAVVPLFQITSQPSSKRGSSRAQVFIFEVLTQLWPTLSEAVPSSEHSFAETRAKETLMLANIGFCKAHRNQFLGPLYKGSFLDKEKIR